MNTPEMMTIRQVASTGLLSEYTLRLLEKQGKLPCIYVGKKCLINYSLLIEWLNDPSHFVNNSNYRKEVTA